MAQSYQTGPRQAVINTGLNDRDTTEWAASETGMVFDNREGEYLRADFELVCTLGGNATVNGTFGVYCVASYDGGTNYSDGSASVLPQPEMKLGDMTITTARTAIRIAMFDKAIPMGFLKFVVQNVSGQTTANDGTGYLYIIPHLRAGV